jgi:tetratricopeptide (TPR) repeat protein
MGRPAGSMKNRALAALFLVLAGTAPAAASQGGANPGEAYLTLAIRYYTGERDAAVEALVELGSSELDAALRALPAALRATPLESDLNRTTLIAAAMVAHVDVVARAYTVFGLERHLAAGQRLADLLAAENGAASAAFRAQWHLAAGTAMLRLARCDEARQQFETARGLRPDDPAILLALGSAHESIGSTGLRADVEPVETRPRPSREAGRQTPDEHLRQATAHYREALARAPDLYEARLRLARSLQLQGRVAEADVEAKMLDTRIADEHLRYLTLLVAGSISEAAGRADDALAKYRGARVLCRGCHSATLALSHALLRTGDRNAAREVVSQLASIRTWPMPADPWLDYLKGQWHRFDSMLERLQFELPT